MLQYKHVAVTGSLEARIQRLNYYILPPFTTYQSGNESSLARIFIKIGFWKERTLSSYRLSTGRLFRAAKRA
eukprot:1349932-Amorphochlora_amoeboformis.AAC.1